MIKIFLKKIIEKIEKISLIDNYNVIQLSKNQQKLKLNFWKN